MAKLWPFIHSDAFEKEEDCFLSLVDSWGRMVSADLLDDATILMAVQW